MTLDKTKAQIIKDLEKNKDEVDKCIDHFQKYKSEQKPPEKPKEPTDYKPGTVAWDWLKSPPLERYDKEKIEILKAAALERGFDAKGMKAPQVHLKLIGLAQGDFEDQKLRPIKRPGLDTSESDTALLMEFNELWAGDDPAAKEYASDECDVSNYDQAKACAAEWIAKYREYQARA